MSTQIQRRRGTTAEHSTFTGVEGELTVDTTKDTVVVHDGATTGGRPLLREDQANLPSSVANGLYTPGTNQVALSTNGTGRLFVDANGRVGIGKSVPTQALHIAANAPYIEFEDIDNNQDWQLQATAWFALRNQTSATELLRITSAGLVGIGSSTPQYVLDVNSSASPVVGINSTNANGGGLKILNSGTDRLYIGSAKWILGGSSLADESALITGGAYSLILGTNGVERARLDSSGRLGIGTTSPIRPLSVSNGGAEGFEFGPGDTAGTNLTLHYNRSTSAYIGSINQANYHTWSAGGASEKMRLDSSGRLLVGTSTSVTANFGAGALQVYNTSDRVASFMYAEANGSGPQVNLIKSRGASPGTRVIVNNNDLLGGFYFIGDDGVDLGQAGASIQAYVDGAPGANDMPGRLVFSTTADGAASPTERMRITSDGRLGVGTSSPGSTFDCRGISSFVGSSAGSAVQVLNLQNIGGNSANTAVEIAFNNSASFNTNQFTKIGAVRTDSPVAGDTNLYFSVQSTSSSKEQLRITSTGVGIGTTSPAVACDVIGQVRASTGILFGSDTAAANALDDYEEGTWTPVIEGTSTTGTGTYAIQSGNYTKIGNSVLLRARVKWTAHTGTGSIFVSGLPFGVSSLSSFAMRTTAGLTVSANKTYIDPSTSKMIIEATITGTGDIILGGQYQS